MTERDPKRARIDGVFTDELAIEALNEANVESTNPADEPRQFQPIYIVGEWEDDREEQRVTIAILMPSGSFERSKDHDIKVTDDGMALEITYVWPQCMTDLLFLHKAELEGDEKKSFQHHPRLLGFRPFLRKLRSKSDHKITSTCSIPLPFPVKNDITIARRRRRILGWNNTGQRVLYVTLEAPDKDYAVECEDNIQLTIA